ncbi:metal tolerance protein 9 isoform X2 [Lingula anatina]|uniref:Metal tolerance protein 9 isoform X2 n=1 Tax=Lingula anatina TaxID=7574 RepID=A0A1S3HVV7_LINAN|nr:metal tolerance protein 9 isoform X2 [Lingula anatina]|eukprot:XP_013390153.1 metal tolerance protein 9 isoform X2 [Lingula anatina]
MERKERQKSPLRALATETHSYSLLPTSEIKATGETVVDANDQKMAAPDDHKDKLIKQEDHEGYTNPVSEEPAEDRSMDKNVLEGAEVDAMLEVSDMGTQTFLCRRTGVDMAEVTVKLKQHGNQEGQEEDIDLSPEVKASDLDPATQTSEDGLQPPGDYPQHVRRLSSQPKQGVDHCAAETQTEARIFCRWYMCPPGCETPDLDLPPLVPAVNIIDENGISTSPVEEPASPTTQPSYCCLRSKKSAPFPKDSTGRYGDSVQERSANVISRDMIVEFPKSAPASGTTTPNGHLSRTHSLDSCMRRRIRLKEVAPSHVSLSDALEQGDEEKSAWPFSINMFTSKKRGKQKEDKKLPKSVRHFYKAQDELIVEFEDTQHLDVDLQGEQTAKEERSKASLVAKITLGINILLMIAKAVAAGLSGSLSVISSLVDSVVDLLSGLVIWWSSRAMKKRDPYVYPQGRTKLEPVAIVILSVIMSLASAQLIVESIEIIVSLAQGNPRTVNMDISTIVIICSTIVIKFILFIFCRRMKNPSIQALAQDHRNDVLSNLVALGMGLIGDKLWPYADPIGAILISLYIAFSWWQMGYEQIKLLTGYTANPKFLQKLTWIGLNHSEKIQQIDTVRAFHFGNNYIVEVDIVLPETMTLKEAHDIGEPLQQKLERLPEVERAFVHLDYEFEHRPSDEHKVV